MMGQSESIWDIVDIVLYLFGFSRGREPRTGLILLENNLLHIWHVIGV